MIMIGHDHLRWVGLSLVSLDICLTTVDINAENFVKISQDMAKIFVEVKNSDKRFISFSCR